METSRLAVRVSSGEFSISISLASILQYAKHSVGLVPMALLSKQL